MAGSQYQPPNDEDAHDPAEWALHHSDEEPEDFFDWCAKLAAAGNAGAALLILNGFNLYHDKGEPIPKAILDHLGQAFRAVRPCNEEDDNPRKRIARLNKALGLVRPNNRPKSSTIENPIAVLAEVYVLLKRHSRTMTKSDAFNQVSRSHEITVRTLENYDQEWGRYLVKAKLYDLLVLSGERK